MGLSVMSKNLIYKNGRYHKSDGFSFVELLIVFTLVGLGLTAVAVNVPGTIGIVQPEAVMAETASLVLEVKGNALTGQNETKRTFTLNSVLDLYPTGVTITVTPPSQGLINCDIKLSNRETICVSGQPVNFASTNQFEFERFSGKLVEPHVIFVKNQRRKLALIISTSGDLSIAELINNRWESRTDLQNLVKPVQSNNIEK